MFSKPSLAKERNIPLTADQSLSTANHNTAIHQYPIPEPNHLPYPTSSEPIFKADCSPTAYYQSQMMLTSLSSGNKHVTHLYFTEISVAFYWVMAEPM